MEEFVDTVVGKVFGVVLGEISGILFGVVVDVEYSRFPGKLFVQLAFVLVIFSPPIKN